MLDIPRNKKIILFDGVCNLCDNTVQKVIKADKNDQFRFASLDSEIGKQILDYIGVDRQKMDSIVLYQPGISYYLKSQAAFKIASYLGLPYSLINIFSVFPKALTDIGYDFIAKNRYKWYGKKESCMIPNESIKQKFL
ncbi:MULTISPECIES: thiol-disulfide oxidoreductase DCC family protein [Myroides]|uniref:Predicted thiol-disulfide oxidoreductase YuxK, DCC family n=1 Tax=Myroides phaeus TaxID=702745 RepID=A0A1G8GIE3_9FLAO|nr:thiol-disulfide oxidoreductase DCC family protein [Myroides phaeus]SDH94047.1 Predicted thiol-disulfide oxidoreductase YuxK, DCC family [Myroides phaeus]